MIENGQAMMTMMIFFFSTFSSLFFSLKNTTKPYDAKLIEFSKQEHKTDSTIKELNPRQQIPTFRDSNGAVVNESLAAVLYLDSTYGPTGTPLVPRDDDVARGAVLQRVFESANLHQAMRDVIYPKMRGLLKSEEDERVWKEEKVEALKAELGRWEAYLSPPAADDAAGGESSWLVPAAKSFSAADVAVGPLLLAVQRFGASFDAFPGIKAYVSRLAERPSVSSSWPPHWKEGDGPGFIKGLL